ncbi:MAG: DUF4388 domain-containing protein [Acidobacteria bacterium]|nr:DUF4388 domain-containing protein [Acidobacteriota bacterium]
MENIDIERTQFVVLTGHLDEQPLADLVRRLRAQRKSGRLQVEYPDGPGSFFFEDGQMVDAQLGELRGVEALYAALSLGGASFNFNPLVRPPERNIDRQGQQFIRDLVESKRREGPAEIRIAGAPGDAQGGDYATLPQRQAPLQLGPAPEELLAPLEERLSAVEGAIDTASRRFSRERLAYAVVIGFLVGLSLITTLNMLYGPFFNGRDAAAAAAPPATAADEPQAVANTQNTNTNPANVGVRQDANPAAGADSRNTNAAARAGENENAEPPPAVASAAAVVGSRRFEGVPAPRREYVVEVLVEVKAGRVADARVWNPRPGASAYEAVALRMARERRYPESFTGGERLRIRVKP